MWKSINFDLKLTTWQQKMKKKISSIDKNIDNFNHGAMGIDQTYRYISQNPVILSETAPIENGNNNFTCHMYRHDGDPSLPDVRDV